MALPNARNQYLKTQIETASKEQLVVMLFDGIIRFTEQARKAIGEKNIEDSHHALMRAQAIIMELICTVDKEKGGEVATNLLSLHAYAFNCLIVCNMQKDVTKIDEVQKIYRDLREGWVSAMDSLGISSNAGKPLAPPPAGAPAPKALSAIGKPIASGPTGSGIMASAAPAGLKPAAPGLAAGLAKTVNAADAVAARPVPAKPAGYGMGMSANLSAAPVAGSAANAYGINKNAAMLGAMMAGAGQAPASAPQPVAQPSAAYAKPAGQVAASGTTPKQSAMLNAYSAGTRSIA